MKNVDGIYVGAPKNIAPVGVFALKIVCRVSPHCDGFQRRTTLKCSPVKPIGTARELEGFKACAVFETSAGHGIIIVPFDSVSVVVGPNTKKQRLRIEAKPHVPGWGVFELDRFEPGAARKRFAANVP